MTPADNEAATVAVEEKTIVRPKRDLRRQTRRKRQPPHAVVLHNDDVNGFDFVIAVLQKVFGYELQKALELTIAAHTSGRSIVWSGTLELAELKADQIVSCGPDPVMERNGALPLKVSVEPQE